LPDYLEIVARKTASLFEQGARTAAYLARRDDAAMIDAMARCGRHVGMTFQMVDDLLDVTADESHLGKPVGLDVRDGNPSLPIVLAVADDREAAQAFARAELDDAEVHAFLERLRRPQTLRRGYALAREHAQAAAAALDELPESAYRENLSALVAQLVGRIS